MPCSVLKSLVTPDDGRRVRHGYFTHRTMQRLRTSRSITSSCCPA